MSSSSPLPLSATSAVGSLNIPHQSVSNAAALCFTELCLAPYAPLGFAMTKQLYAVLFDMPVCNTFHIFSFSPSFRVRTPYCHLSSGGCFSLQCAVSWAVGKGSPLSAFLSDAVLWLLGSSSYGHGASSPCYLLSGSLLDISSDGCPPPPVSLKQALLLLFILLFMMLDIAHATGIELLLLSPTLVLILSCCCPFDAVR